MLKISIKILALSVMLVTLSGCYALKPVSMVANDICENRTDAENALLAEKVDKATHPHVIRVSCYQQVEGKTSK